MQKVVEMDNIDIRDFSEEEEELYQAGNVIKDDGKSENAVHEIIENIESCSNQSLHAPQHPEILFPNPTEVHIYFMLLYRSQFMT